MLALIALAFTVAAAPPQKMNEAGVRAVEDSWSAAFLGGDATALDALLTPAYVSVGANGVAHDKAAIINAAISYAAQHPGQRAKPMPATSTVELIGSTALVRHHGEKDISMDLFKFEDGQWHAVYSQHTAISPPAA